MRAGSEPLYEFTLVDYESNKPYRDVQKIVNMTEREAQQMNEAFALNFSTKRYVRLDSRSEEEGSS